VEECWEILLLKRRYKMNRDVLRWALIDVLGLLKFELERKLDEKGKDDILWYKTKDGEMKVFPQATIKELIEKFDRYIEEIRLMKEESDGD